MNLNFKWVTQTGQFQTGEDLYLNRIQIGGYSWNSSHPRDLSEEAKRRIQYVGRTSLVDKTFYGESPVIVKDKLEHIVTAWFNEALK